MLPRLAVNNRVNSRPVHAVFCGKCPSGRAFLLRLADSKHLLGGKPVVAATLTAPNHFRVDMRRVLVARKRAALSGSVLHVILACAKKHMCWIDTSAIIACMADKQTLRNAAVREDVGKSVRPNLLAVNNHNAISGGTNRTAPRPTGFGVVGPLYVRPESYEGICSSGFAVAGHGTVFAIPIAHLRRRCEKRPAANLTYPWNLTPLSHGNLLCD